MLSSGGFPDEASNSSSVTSQHRNNYAAALIMQHNKTKFLINL